MKRVIVEERKNAFVVRVTERPLFRGDEHTLIAVTCTTAGLARSIANSWATIHHCRVRDHIEDKIPDRPSHVVIEKVAGGYIVQLVDEQGTPVETNYRLTREAAQRIANTCSLANADCVVEDRTGLSLGVAKTLD
jgi:hypothetical protein